MPQGRGKKKQKITSGRRGLTDVQMLERLRILGPPNLNALAKGRQLASFWPWTDVWTRAIHHGLPPTRPYTCNPAVPYEGITLAMFFPELKRKDGLYALSHEGERLVAAFADL